MKYLTEVVWSIGKDGRKIEKYQHQEKKRNREGEKKEEMERGRGKGIGWLRMRWRRGVAKVGERNNTKRKLKEEMRLVREGEREVWGGMYGGR